MNFTKCPLCNIDEYAREVVTTGKEPDKMLLVPYLCDGHLCESICAVLVYVKDGVVSPASKTFNYTMNDHKKLLKLSTLELASRVEKAIQ